MAIGFGESDSFGKVIGFRSLPWGGSSSIYAIFLIFSLATM